MRKAKYLLILIIVASACKKPYYPPVKVVSSGYLVVEGVINSGSDSTFIKLSRTVNLATNASVTPELNAAVSVQGDQNTFYPLTETGNGNYVCAGLNLDNTHKYRLTIKTTNGEQFLSDYMEVLNSPPIDSVSYDTKGTVSGPGLNIYVNTHDPANKVVNYRWEYQETWMIQSNFSSYFKSNGDTVLGRDMVNDNITDCWLGDKSSTIVLGSSAKLSRHVIVNSPVISIASSSEKLRLEYSILVRQYALTPDAYSFYTNLKKNTEQLGSIFDAEPTEIKGNLHDVTNPSEPVIGYIGVGGTTSLRIFIPNRLLPAWVATPYDSNCTLAFDAKNPCCFYNFNGVNQVSEYLNYNNRNFMYQLIPINAIGMPGMPPIGYTASSSECVDCTLRGSNKKPAFWP